MKVLIPIFLALLKTAAVFAQDNSNLPTITTPAAITECQPASFTISGGAGGAPYTVAVIPAGEISAAAIENLPNVAAAGAFTWTVNLAAGTAISLRIADADGNTNYSAQMTVLAGTDTSCVGTSASVTAASAGSTTTAAASGASSGSSGSTTSSSSSSGTSTVSRSSSATSTGTATSAASSGSSTGTATSATSASSAAATTSKGAAVANKANTGFFAVVLGAVVALAA